MPLAATTTKLHITSSATSPTNRAAKDVTTLNTERDLSTEQEVRKSFSTAPKAEKSGDATPKTPPKTRDTATESKDHVVEISKATDGSTGWLNWFSKPESVNEGKTAFAQPDEDASSAGKRRPQSTTSEILQDAPTSPQQRRNSEPSLVSPNLQQEETPRSWLSLWGNASTQKKSSSSASAVGVASNPRNDSTRQRSQTAEVSDAEPGLVSPPQPPQQPGDGPKPSYGWAFWSREHPKSDDERTSPGKEVGELALAGSSSQSKPESAAVDEARGIPNKVGKRQRPQSLEVAEDPKKPRDTGDDAEKESKSEGMPLAPRTKSKVDANLKATCMPENLLLPPLKSTYSTVGRPSLIQQISKFFQLSASSEPKHVDIIPNPPRLKRALAIVSLSQSMNIILMHIANMPSVGCSWLFPSTVDSLCPGSTHGHVHSFCQ